MQLTDQQQAVVEHNLGPGLVFAVAGAGKTTALVHRLERLVRQKVFEPRRILVSSFSRASVADLRQALGRWPYLQGLSVSTLHAVGLRLIHRAIEAGLYPALPQRDPGQEGTDRQLLAATLRRVREQQPDWVEELEELDTEDFLSYLGVCKGNLLYPNLEQAQLPEAAQKVAGQARAPLGLDWYLDLYRIYEEVRQEQGLITFDDMLLTGWELLVRHPPLRSRIQQAFSAVMVDEFQDVNRAQSELLDLITQAHRNYMVVGDDDQTIYEWRGASPRYILEFGQRYQAKTYLIADTFRCPGPQVALANRVIAHNQTRQAKTLSLTRGFGGKVHLEVCSSIPEQARRLVDQVQAYHQQGTPLDQMAVLVRLYAQTPYLEQYLIERGIAYRVLGNQPFYQRPEIRTLLHYLELALYEHHPDRAQHGNQQAERWMAIYSRPSRYLSRLQAEAIAQSLRQGKGLAPSLRQWADREPRLGERLRSLAWLLEDLGPLLEVWPADRVLRLLEERLGYSQWLRQQSSMGETGQGKAEGVVAFLDYAQGKGSSSNLLVHLQQLAQLHHQDRQALELLTIHRSKGLEWPVVFIPDCNHGILPFSGNPNREEERRLFYVALTRSKNQTHLYQNGDGPSPFLTEAGLPGALEALEQLAASLAEEVPAAPGLLFLAQQGHQWHLERFLTHWWKGSLPQLARRVLARFEPPEQWSARGLNQEGHRFWQTLSMIEV